MRCQPTINALSCFIFTTVHNVPITQQFWGFLALFSAVRKVLGQVVGMPSQFWNPQFAIPTNRYRLPPMSTFKAIVWTTEVAQIVALEIERQTVSVPLWAVFITKTTTAVDRNSGYCSLDGSRISNPFFNARNHNQ